MKKKLISIIISAYNEETNIIPLYKEIKKHINQIDRVIFEMIFVDDGSRDTTFEKIMKLYADDGNVKCVRFTRNFGHEIAMTAGMDHAKGDAIIFMDADLQHPPELIEKMVRYWLEGMQIVLTKRVDEKGSSISKKLSSAIYYKLLNLLSDTNIPAKAPDFRLIDRKYINIIQKMNERDRMFRGMLNWMGIPDCKVIDFVAPERFSGKTKYNVRRSMTLAIDGIVQFTIKPLRVATYFGVASAILSIYLGLYTVWEFFALNKPTTGFTTIIVTVVFLGSIQLVVLGIIGEYIGRIHLETKRRPLYVAEFYSNMENNEDKRNCNYSKC